MHYLLMYLAKRDLLNHPLTLHELKRLPSFGSGFRNWIRAFAVVGGLEFIFTLPGCWVPFVHWLWRFPAILAASTAISREVEDRTWNPLLVTVVPVRDIVLTKFAAVMRYMDSTITLLTYVRAVPIIIFGVTWVASTLTVLPRQGFTYWFTYSLAFLVSAIYLLAAPVLDVGVDAALGLLASTFSQRRSTAMVLGMLARIALWLMPLALAAPLQYGLIGNAVGVPSADVVVIRAVAIVSTFGPGYAFLWGISVWVSILVLLVTFAFRVALIRFLLYLITVRVSRMEV